MWRGHNSGIDFNQILSNSKDHKYISCMGCTPEESAIYDYLVLFGIIPLLTLTAYDSASVPFRLKDTVEH